MIHVAGAPLTRWNSARSPAHGRAHHWSAPSQPKLCAARRLHGVTPSAPAAPAASTTTAAPSRRSLMIASPLLLLGGWLGGVRGRGACLMQVPRVRVERVRVVGTCIVCMTWVHGVGGCMEW
eukprot:361808-Chlamydomonas_euryale.AAC.24